MDRKSRSYTKKKEKIFMKKRMLKQIGVLALSAVLMMPTTGAYAMDVQSADEARYDAMSMQEEDGASEEEDTQPTSGKCGESVKWVYDEEKKLLEISGKGKMDDFYYYQNYYWKTPSWISYLDDIEEVRIQKGVTSIGECTFALCKSLKRVTIADSVTSIGKSAFSNCESLKYVTIPNSVKSIGEQAFASCKSLSSITIPNGITHLEYFTFYNTALKRVVIPKSVESVNHSFDCCKDLKEITVEKGNKNYKSFDGSLYSKDGKEIICYSAKDKIIIPDTVEELHIYDLRDQYRSKPISLYFQKPEKIKRIYTTNYATYHKLTIYGNSEAQNLAIQIGCDFHYYNGNLSNVNAEKKVKAGGMNYCITSQKKDGTGTVTLLGVASKKEKGKLKTLKIDTVKIKNVSYRITAIGNNAFAGCNALKSVTIGNYVTLIGKNAFKGDKNLQKLTITSTKLTRIGSSAISGIANKAVIKVPKKQEKRYKKLFTAKTGFKSRTMKLTK